MWPKEPDEARSDLEVSICGPNHSGWCKYCLARAQIQISVNDEREVCAHLAEFLIESKEQSEWQEGFNMACRILSQAIHARSSETSEKVVRSFKQLSRSIAAARGATAPEVPTLVDRAGNCSLSESSLVSSAGRPAH